MQNEVLMKILLLVLIGVLSATLRESRPIVNQSSSTETSNTAMSNKVSITFIATVKSIEQLGDRELQVIPVGLDSRFAVTVHIESVTPKEAPLNIDTDQSFAVHSPAQLFHDEKKNIISRKYQFKAVWNGMRTNPKFHGLSAVPIVDKATQRRVSVNGLSFAYVEQGSGATVILVHGAVSDYREWAGQMAALAPRYRVIAYSRRYHWPNSSPGADADVRVEVQADDLAAIIKALGVAPAHIVGHSFGGAVALNLTLNHPELVRTLVLAEPAVSGVLGNISENDPVMKDSQAVRAEMKEAFETGDAETIVRTYAAHVAPGEFEKASPDVRQMLLTNAPAFRLDFTSRRPPFTCDDAGRVTVPVLVMSGGRSALGLQRIAASAARCIRGAKLVTLPEATHWLQHDQAQAFNEVVLAFLAGTGK